MQLVARDADVLVKFEPLFLPIFEQFHSLLGSAKIFQLHLLELARPKSEIAWINFVAKRFTDLRNAEWQFFARNFQNIFELDKNGLCCLRTQVSDGAFICRGTHMRFEHQIELARFGQVFATAVWTLLDSLFLNELIEPQVRLA